MQNSSAFCANAEYCEHIKKQGSDGGCRWESRRQEGGKKEVAAGSDEMIIVFTIVMIMVIGKNKLLAV